MVGWHHQHNGHEFGWTLGAGDGQGGLACCSPWDRTESDMTESLTTVDWCFSPSGDSHSHLPRGHLGMLEGIFVVSNWGGALLASSG